MNTLKINFDDVFNIDNDIEIINNITLLKNKTLEQKINILKYGLDSIKLRYNNKDELTEFINNSSRYEEIFMFIVNRIDNILK